MMATTTTTTKTGKATGRGAKAGEGLPPGPRIAQKRQLDAQDRFLALFATHGNVLQSASGAAVGRRTVYDWEQGDVQGFRQRFEHARHAYREAAEAQMDDRLADPTGNRGSDILLMFKLKALWPDKYREAVVVVDDTAKRLLDRLGRGKARSEAGVNGGSEVGR